MKMKNNRGLVLGELLLIIAFIAVVFAIVAFIALKDGNKRKYEVFAQNARDFASKVVTYREEYAKYDNEIYLYELVEANYIKAFKNPFPGGGTCDLYESKVVIVSTKERYVTLKCGDYLIDNQKAISNNYRVYKVSKWQEEIGMSPEAETAKLYNYEKNGQLMLNNYVGARELIALYNEKENQKIDNIDKIDLTQINIITKTFYRTKELMRENL